MYWETMDLPRCRQINLERNPTDFILRDLLSYVRSLARVMARKIHINFILSTLSLMRLKIRKKEIIH